MTVVVDDLLLARIIVTGDPRGVAMVGAEQVLTTSLWWYRLARAILGGGAGRLSSALADLDLESRRALVSELPRGTEVRGLATLAPLAAEWSERAGARGVRLNALAAEAVAVTMESGAELFVETPSPSLAAASSALGFEYRVVSDRE